MANPIKKEDLVQEGALVALINELGKVEGAAKQLESTLKLGVAKAVKEISVIKLNGSNDIKELITSTETLSNKTKALDIVQKAAQDTELRKIKVAKELEKLTQTKIQTSQKQLASEKQLTKAIEEETKAEERKLKALEKANSAYAQSVGQLAKVKSELKDLIIAGKQGTDQFKKLEKQFITLDSSVRETEESVGEYFRSVGNYEKGTVKLTTELRNLQNQLSKLDPNSKEFQELSKQAGEVKDKISDAKDAVKAFSAESKAGQAKELFGQFTSSLGNLDFKDASDKAKQFSKVVASISFAEVVGGLKDLGSALFDVGKAIIANPLTLLLVGVTAVVGGIYAYTQALKDNEDAIKTNNDFLNKSKEIYIGLAESIAARRRELLLSKGIITKSEFDIQNTRIAGLKAAREEELRFAELKKQLQIDYGVNEKGILKDIANATGINRNILIEQQKNYNKKVLEAEKEKTKNIKLILEDSKIQQQKILQDQTNEDSEKRKKAEEERAEKSKAALEKLKKEQTERAEFFRKQSENEAKETAENNQDASDKLAEITKENDEKEKAAAKEKSNFFKDLFKSNRDSEIAANEEAEKLRLKAIEKERKERIKLANDLINLTEKELAAKNEKEIKAIDDQIKRRQDSISKQQALAERGAANTLAFEQEQLAKEQLAKQDAQEKAQRNEEILAFLKLLSGYAEKDPTTALPNASKDIALAQIVKADFQFAADGNNDIQGPGTTTSDSIPFMLSKHEGVVKAESNMKHKGVVAALNENKFDEFVMQKYLPRVDTGSTATNINNSLQIQQLKRLESLENTIKNKKEVELHLNNLGEVIRSETVKGIKKTTLFKRSRI